MPQCAVCKQFLPSDFCEKDVLANIHRCHFCIKGNNVIYEGNIMYIKQDVVHDYEVFTKTIANSSNVKEKIKELTIESAVEKYKNEQ